MIFSRIEPHLPEVSSTMRVLIGARCTDVRLNTLQIKVATRKTSTREVSHG